MQKQPKATAMVRLGMFGLVMMLAMSSCESVTVEPVPLKTQPTVRTTVADDDPPQKPTRPPGVDE
ncbi:MULTISPECIES: hypothetical protein [Spirosoma]|uniref:hypothetical protein n=1 Tax=Spirosoma TaxID=107 RepID=UPI00095A6F6B|nr:MULTISPECIES: hypothetical protein [Spirosoma]MBN8826623.1 hypothetical protein [Spirosoma sp.]OJW74461.1 MAG: hypothetical protein BGO59_20640 [Spirosoma sp. 48-14]